MDLAGVGTLLVGVAAVGTMLISLRNGRKTDAVSKQLAKASEDNLAATAEVKHEVKNGNSQTLAQLGTATERRRVGEIPEGERTAMETRSYAESEGDER